MGQTQPRADSRAYLEMVIEQRDVLLQEQTKRSSNLKYKRLFLTDEIKRQIRDKKAIIQTLRQNQGRINDQGYIITQESIDGELKSIHQLIDSFKRSIRTQEGVCSSNLKKLTETQERELKLKKQTINFIDNIQRATNIVPCILRQITEEQNNLGQYECRADQIRVPHPAKYCHTLAGPTLVHELIHKLNRFIQRRETRDIIDNIKQDFRIRLAKTENLYDDYYEVEQSLKKMSELFQIILDYLFERQMEEEEEEEEEQKDEIEGINKSRYLQTKYQNLIQEISNFDYMLEKLELESLENIWERRTQIKLICKQSIDIIRDKLEFLDISSEFMTIAGKKCIDTAFNLRGEIKKIFKISQGDYEKKFHFFREIGPRIHEYIMYKNAPNLEQKISSCQNIEVLDVLRKVADLQCLALEHYGKNSKFKANYKHFCNAIQTRINALKAQIHSA